MERKNWFNKEIEEIEKELKTHRENGLTQEQVKQIREQKGYNELQAGKKKSLFQRFLDQFKDFSIIILIIAAVVSGVVGVQQGNGITDTIIILIVVLVNAIIGVAQESKAEKSLEALQKLSDHASKVIRDGNMQVVPAKELVPGDLVVLDTGDYIPADLRIVEEVNLKLQDALAKQTVITPTTDIKNLEKQIDEKTQNLRNLTDIHKITEYKKEIEELASKKAKIVGALSQSGAYIQELTKQKEQYEAQLISDSEYITAPVSGVVSYRVDGLEDALSTNDLSNLTEEKLENLGLKTGKIISTSQEARKNNK